MRHIGEILQDVLSDLGYRAGVEEDHQLRSSRSRLSGIATGFSDPDNLTAGLQRSNLVVIAGVPSIGKTSLALGMAYSAAVIHGRTVGYFSLDSRAVRIMERMLAIDSGVETERLRTGHIVDSEWDRLARAFGRLSDSPFFVEDRAATLPDIRSRSQELRRDRGLHLIIVDSLNPISSVHRDFGAQAVSNAIRSLKALAKEIDAPVVVLVPLPTSIENRVNAVPLLEDLPGSVAEDADMAIFVYREDRYDWESGKKGIAEIIVAKHRNGPVGSINLRFFDRTARFSDLEVYPVLGA